MYGIAKDGHPIYGPYNDDGELWQCDDHDICNGAFLENGFYAYVTTTTYPYVVGCWGPGDIQYYPVETTCANYRCYAVYGYSMAALAIAAYTALFN